MATFTLNINAQVSTPYQTAHTSYAKGSNCSGFLNSYTVSIANTTGASTVGLLAPWLLPSLGLTLTTLYIKDIVYTDSNKLWYEYNGTKLLPSTEYTIDITGLSYLDLVPLLSVVEAQPSLDDTTQVISCRAALEDNNPTKYGYKDNQVTIYYDPC